MHTPSRTAAACALRRTVTSLLLSAALLGAAGPSQAAYNIWTSEYTARQQELQAVIATQFPRKLRYLQIIEINLSNPRLSLNPASNRLITTVDAQIDNKLLMSRPVTGTLSMSTALRYDAASHAVRLDSPAVERIDIPGLPPQYAAQLNEIGNTAARQVLDNYPIYTFQPEQLEMNGQHIEPGAITVLENGIKVDIKPM